MLDHLERELKIRRFRHGWGRLGGYFPIRPGLHGAVHILFDHPVEQCLHLFLRKTLAHLAQDPPVLFRLQKLQCVTFKIRCDEYFKEDLIDLPGSRQVYFGIGDQDAAERGYRISGKRILPGFQYGRPGGDPAAVGMFDHDKGGIAEFPDQVNSSVNVHQVIVGKCLSAEHIEDLIEIAVERTGLMGVLPIPQNLSFRVTDL